MIFQCTEVYRELSSVYSDRVVTDECWNGLALLFIHADNTVDCNAVIRAFWKSIRRLVLILGLGLLNETVSELELLDIE